MTSGVGVASKKGRCHPLWQKLLECRDNSLYPRKDCVLAADDYMECLHHRKEKARMIEIIRQLQSKHPTN